MAPTHLPSPKSLAEGFNLVILQLLEKGTHLEAGKKRV